MAHAGYIPRKDIAFDLFQSNLITLVAPNIDTWGILASDFTELKNAQAVWTDAFGKAVNKQNRTSADVQAKADARVMYEKELRRFVGQWLAKNAKVPDSERERMGLTVRTNAHTLMPTPTTSPIGWIDFSLYYQHTVHFKDEASPRRAKPKGVHGCEIWMKLEADDSQSNPDYTYVATSTCSPYLNKFDESYAGKKVSYRFRWVNTRGEFGPWSVAISGMVVG